MLVLKKIVYTTANRIGIADQPKRPIIVEFDTEHDKNVLCKYKGISITDGYTVTEREMIKDYKKRQKK